MNQAYRQMYGKLLAIFSVVNGVFIIICWTFECHDDPDFEPEEGPLTELQYSWLGALQYIHIKDGTPHYFRVPRVALISRQFALSTARDAAEIPEGFSLGNVVFAEYERDESECQVTKAEMAESNSCEPAVLLMPIADVLLHPEYKHFGIRTSVALLKLLIPIKSKYMLPACLPLKDFLRRNGRDIFGLLIYIDFVSEVPRDFVDEEKEVLYLRRLHSKKCMGNVKEMNNATLPVDRYLCTTGCDLQSGSPSVVHEHTGHWNVVALSEGGSACPDPMRSRGAPLPSRHILVQPYVSWITTAISGKPVGVNTKDDPFGYVRPRVFTFPERVKGWVGKWWMGGTSCYDRGDAAENVYRFYHEIFDIYPDLSETKNLLYYLEIHAGHSLYIVCVKVGMPYQMTNPKIWGINTPIAKLRIPLLMIKSKYRIIVEAWTNNGTSPEEEGEQGDSAEEGESDTSDEYGEAKFEYIGYDEELKKMGKKRTRRPTPPPSTTENPPGDRN